MDVQPVNDTTWAKRAKTIVRAEMVKRDLTYQDLERLLRRVGVEKNAGNLAARVASGSFGVQLFLQMMLAMGVRNIDISYLLPGDDQGAS